MAVPVLAAAAIAGPIIGGVIGNMASAADRRAAQDAAQRAFEIIDQIGAPPDLSREIIYDQFQQVGVLTPELEEAINVGVSKVAEIQEKPEFREAQLTALETLKERGRGGLSAEDRAALNQIRSQVAQDQEAKRQQILQAFAQRGQLGSGQELAAQLSAQQQGAQIASQQGDQLAAMASQRALEAMMQAGQLGTQVRGQEFDVEQAKASAADAFKQFDIQNAIARQQRNIGAKNVAQESNLATQQRIAEQNVAQKNAELLRQAEARRQKWLDELSFAQAKAGTQAGIGASKERAADRSAQMWQSIGSGVGSGAGALASHYSKK